MTTSVSSARTALHTLLAATAPASLMDPTVNVRVAFTPPADVFDQELICLERVEVSEDYAALGANRHEEISDITVLIQAHMPHANTPAEVDARVWVLYQHVRTVIAANRTLSGSVQHAHTIGATSDGPQAMDSGGWGALVTARVRCKQRIT